MKSLVKILVGCLPLLLSISALAAAESGNSQFEAALEACEKLTGTTLPRPPERPTLEQMAILKTCQENGIRLPRPPGPPPPLEARERGLSYEDRF